MTTADPLTAINPLTDDAAARLAIDAAEREMLEALIATPAAAPVSPPPRRSSARRRRALAVIGAVAVAAPVLAVLAVLPTDRPGHPQPFPPAGHAVAPATGPSPRVLLQLSGWRVYRADEESPVSGELDFKRAGVPGQPLATQAGGASLTWYPASEEGGYIQDRANEASVKTTMPLLGAIAHLFQYKRSLEPQKTFTSIWIRGTRALIYEARARDMSAFKTQLGHLHVVDDATWLNAMPASTITPRERAQTIRTMLKGIPLPPGFDVRQIPGATLVRDRYQLGSAVTGTVACEWFARWGRARQAGNRTAVNQAVTAMATAKRWPILRQMSTQGGWTQILESYVKAMPSGVYFKRPLLGDVNSGLGCSSEWHVNLGTVTAPSSGLQPVPSS